MPLVESNLEGTALSHHVDRALPGNNAVTYRSIRLMVDDVTMGYVTDIDVRDSLSLHSIYALGNRSRIAIVPGSAGEGTITLKRSLLFRSTFRELLTHQAGILNQGNELFKGVAGAPQTAGSFSLLDINFPFDIRLDLCRRPKEKQEGSPLDSKPPDIRIAMAIYRDCWIREDDYKISSASTDAIVVESLTVCFTDKIGHPLWTSP